MSARRSAGAGALVAAILLLFALQLYAFRWGVITPDTVEQYRQALSGRYEDWHPPVMAFLWRQLGRIAPGSAPFLLLDCALYWIGIGGVAEGFRRRGQHKAAAFAILIGALPIPFGQIGAILKDALLAAALVAATGLLAIDLLPARAPAPWRRLAAVLLVALAGAVRSNGVLAAAPMLVLAAAPLAWKPRRSAAWLLPAGVLLFGASLLANQMLLRPKQTHPLLSVLHFDVAGISAATGTNVYPAPRPDLALVRRCYTPALYNPTYRADCNGPEDGFFRAALGGPRSGAALWLGAVRAAPFAYVTHRARHFNAAMRWWERAVPDDAVYVMSQPNDLGLAFAGNGATRPVYRAASVMAASPLGRPATWWAAAAGLLLLAPGLRCGALVAGLAGSALLYGAGYAVAGVAPDLRYNLWTMLAAMLATLVALADPARRRPGARRWALAAALPALAVAGELAAMVGG